MKTMSHDLLVQVAYCDYSLHFIFKKREEIRQICIPKLTTSLTQIKIILERVVDNFLSSHHPFA